MRTTGGRGSSMNAWHAAPSSAIAMPNPTQGASAGRCAGAASSLIQSKWQPLGFFRRHPADTVPARFSVGAVEVFFEADRVVFIIAAEADEHPPEGVGVGFDIEGAGRTAD